jgi:hypothetical protein
MTVDRTKLNFYSGDLIDKIIGVYTGTLSVSAPSASPGHLSVTDTHPHDFRDSAYFQGRFSTDGGTTWNDFGAQTPNLSGTFPVFQTADCTGFVDATSVNVKAISWYDNVAGVGHAFTFTYEIFAIAKNTMALPITPLAANNNLFLSSNTNYQKIALQGTAAISVASGATGSVVIPHGLEKVPNVRAWWFDAATPTVCRSLVPDATDIKYAEIQVKVDPPTSSIIFYVDGSGVFSPNTIGNVEYRVYYD